MPPNKHAWIHPTLISVSPALAPFSKPNICSLSQVGILGFVLKAFNMCQTSQYSHADSSWPKHLPVLSRSLTAVILLQCQTFINDFIPHSSVTQDKNHDLLPNLLTNICHCDVKVHCSQDTLFYNFSLFFRIS